MGGRGCLGEEVKATTISFIKVIWDVTSTGDVNLLALFVFYKVV